MDTEKSLGQIAFEAYVISKNGITYDNKPIPVWKDLSEDVKNAWEAASKAVVTYCN